jgi:hypothetical protein
LASWRDSGGPALAVATAVASAVAAAAQRDRDAFEPAAAELAALPAQQTGAVLAAIARTLLEEQHPDGLDGDDVRTIVERCVRAAVTWLPADALPANAPPANALRPRTIVAVLANALGVHEAGLTYDELGAPPDPDLEKAPSPADFARHAPLVIADLLATAGRPLRPYLDAAFTEIARAETMDA